MLTILFAIKSNVWQSTSIIKKKKERKKKVKPCLTAYMHLRLMLNHSTLVANWFAFQSLAKIIKKYACGYDLENKYFMDRGFVIFKI